MIRFLNRKSVSADTLRKCQSLAEFVMDKFFTKRKQDVMEINIVFKKGMFDRIGQWGNCIWEDQHIRPNDFVIEIDADQNIGMILNTLAHELVHVKQWAKGEFYQHQSDQKIFTYQKMRYNVAKVDYWDQPWEIEAHGRAIGLVVQWARKNDLHNDRSIVGEG